MINLTAVKDYPTDRVVASPNSSKRKSGAITAVVLHATKGNWKSSEGWLADPKSGVSAHLLFRKDGSVTRHVPDVLKAWHAGTSSWRGQTNVNDYSLGWEIENKNDGGDPYPTAQVERVADAARFYIAQGLFLHDFTTHAVVALPKGRKSDPDGFPMAAFHTLIDKAPEPAGELAGAHRLAKLRWVNREEVSPLQLLAATETLSKLVPEMVATHNGLLILYKASSEIR